MPIRIRQFLELGREPLKLSVVCGESHLDRPIPEDVPNRPGLALAGFTKHFAHRRIQVFGLAETSYLKHLPPAEAEAALRRMFEAHIPCLVFSRNLKVPEAACRMASQYRVPILRTPMTTSDFVQRATILIEESTAPRLRHQGTMVDIMGIGVMIEGPPGIGKSETALGLILRGYSLVADDLTELTRASNGELFGSAVEVTRFHMEIRGLGIIHVPSLFGVGAVRRRKRLDLIVRLEHAAGNGTAEDRTGLVPEMRPMLGASIPCVTLRVTTGRDLTNLVETAALNLRLKQLGHDAAKELDQRLMRNLMERD